MPAPARPDWGEMTVDEGTVRPQFREDIDELDSRDPLQRLTAVRNVRAVIESLETAAVAQARSPGGRHSWDEIARVMGTTRWSVLRRFGPRGSHPAEDVPGSAVEASGPAVHSSESLRQLESLPPEILQKAILLAGELATSNVREGRDDPSRGTVSGKVNSLQVRPEQVINRKLRAWRLRVRLIFAL